MPYCRAEDLESSLLRREYASPETRRISVFPFLEKYFPVLALFSTRPRDYFRRMTYV
jgi:hypothetical protein